VTMFSEMKKNWLLASRNKKKAQELESLLSRGINTSDAPKIQTVLDFPDLPEVDEDGATFEENALKKALVISRLVLIPVLADDSGLEVDALGGRPGVHSARFAGSHGDDDANNARLLYEMESVTDKLRGAQFRCAVAVAFRGEKLFIADGVCRGSILRAKLGDSGFGYDPLFVPDGFSESFGVLSSEIKNSISHRAQALGQVIRWIKESAV